MDNRINSARKSSIFMTLTCSKDATVGKDLAKHCYETFLQEGLKNPTTACIAYKSAQNRLTPKENFDLFVNLRNIEDSNPEIKNLHENLIKNYRKNYPATGGLRATLIEADRFSLTSVKPKMAKGLKKFALRFMSIL
jgi:hypothetical protein